MPKKKKIKRIIFLIISLFFLLHAFGFLHIIDFEYIARSFGFDPNSVHSILSSVASQLHFFYILAGAFFIFEIVVHLTKKKGLRKYVNTFDAFLAPKLFFAGILFFDLLIAVFLIIFTFFALLLFGVIDLHTPMPTGLTEQEIIGFLFLAVFFFERAFGFINLKDKKDKKKQKSI